MFLTRSQLKTNGCKFKKQWFQHGHNFVHTFRMDHDVIRVPNICQFLNVSNWRLRAAEHLENFYYAEKGMTFPPRPNYHMETYMRPWQGNRVSTRQVSHHTWVLNMHSLFSRAPLAKRRGGIAPLGLQALIWRRRLTASKSHLGPLRQQHVPKFHCPLLWIWYRNQRGCISGWEIFDIARSARQGDVISLVFLTQAWNTHYGNGNEH